VGIVSAFRWWAGRQQAVASEVRSRGLDPYWQAILAQDYARARQEGTTPAWQQRHSAKDLQSNYQAATSQYGKLHKFVLQSAHEGHEPGQDGRQVWAKCTVEFERGPLEITYQLIRRNQESDWKVDRSSSHSQGSPPGPW
jgi:hypothetical protein